MKKFLSGVLILALLLCCGLLALRRQAVLLKVKEPEQTAQTQEQTQGQTAAEKAAALLSSMTPEEKVWQMLIVFPQDVCGELSTADEALWETSLRARPAGGVVISGDNMSSPEELKAMLSAIGGAGRIPCFLCVDEEGGMVARLRYNLGVTTKFDPMYRYKDAGPETARSNAQTIAEDIRSFGFNVDFAPVADVWTNPENTVIGERAYSDDAVQAAALVRAATEGFNDGGVIPTLKHFPGHGDTAADSHLSAAVSGRSAEELAECEFLPFISGIEAGAGMVMIGHITLTGVDPERPATLSEPVVTGLLRKQLGYNGVVITDSFQMAAISAYGETEAAAAAIRAGCDLLLCPADPAGAAQAILNGAEEARIDESVLRILTLKYERGILN